MTHLDWARQRAACVLAIGGWCRLGIRDSVGQKAIQALAFFPTDIFVNVGDTITWNFDAAEVHTVTFLKPGQAPPGAGAPATPDNFIYNGTEFVNSGVLTGPGSSYSIVFNATGDFNYLCLIHARTMTARIHVNPVGTPYPHTQAFYDRQAREQADLVLEDGQAIRADSRDSAQDTGKIVTGGGDAQVFVARFRPALIPIFARCTATWVWSARGVHLVLDGRGVRSVQLPQTAYQESTVVL